MEARARFRSWMQKLKQHRITILVVAIILIVAIAFIILGYRFDWTGFNGKNKSGKTLWDWLQLLFVPVVIAIAGYWLNRIQKDREQRATVERSKQEMAEAEKRAHIEREIAQDNQHETALQAYIDKMSELLLLGHLSESSSNPQVESIARARTVTVLRILDPGRRGSLIRFLSQAGILNKCIKDELNRIDLHGANLTRINLSKIDLKYVNLNDANLSYANLSGADLRYSSLNKAYLYAADLSDADLTSAKLNKADLTGVNLSNANLFYTDLSQAELNWATLSRANLSYANLTRADLSPTFGNDGITNLNLANLYKANLSKARLDLSNLSFANLRDADLRDADLRDADLSSADLSGARVANEQLDTAKSLKGATMPDGSIHP